MSARRRWKRDKATRDMLYVEGDKVLGRVYKLFKTGPESRPPVWMGQSDCSLFDSLHLLMREAKAEVERCWEGR